MSHQRRRRASHSGSWYTSSSRELRSTLSTWLDHAKEDLGNFRPLDTLHAIIAPHAGYTFSGSTAAYAYCAIDPDRFNRVFVLGPSHHVYLRDRCALSRVETLETPLGSLHVDTEVVAQLLQSKTTSNRGDSHVTFTGMDTDVDEAEHSIEMHLPYIKHVFGQKDVKVVPIMVGSLSERAEKAFGKVLSKWLGDGETLFVISSDFCHWGSRFGYTRIDRGDSGTEIWQCIEHLDKEGMAAIETGVHARFCDYQARTENTVCGRHPIGVLMAATEALRKKDQSDLRVKFVKYHQSSKCRTLSDSSVSYASAWSVTRV